jgi:uncharacterized membrane protein YdfJ with MMPL/SSD domain
LFARLGPWCHDHRWKVVIGWVVLLVFANGIAGAIGDAYRQDFSLDGFESTDGFTLVESEFDDGSGSPQSGQIVFQSEQGVDDTEVQAAMEELFAEVAEIEDVVSVQSPYAPRERRPGRSPSPPSTSPRTSTSPAPRRSPTRSVRSSRRSKGCGSSWAGCSSPSSSSRRPSCSASPSR